MFIRNVLEVLAPRRQYKSVSAAPVSLNESALEPE